MQRAFHRRSMLAAALVALAGAPLGGCAGIGDGFASSAFVSPGKYDLYDCKRLETARASLAKDADEKQRLIDKANTGVGGAVVGEMVYRSDYTALRAQKKLADESWRSNNCDAVTPPSVTAPAGAVTSGAPGPAVPRSTAPATSAGRAIN